MDLEILKKQVLVGSSSLTREQAEKIIKKKDITGLKGKSIDGIYNLYGKILSTSRDEETYIKINTKTSKIIKSSCTCKRFEENRREYDRYMCMHIISTIELFYRIAKKKEKKVLENREGKKYRLQTKIKVIENKGINSFLCSFSIGEKHFIPILDLRGFVESFLNKKKIKITDLEWLDPRIDTVEGTILNFIISKKEKITGSSIKIYKQELKSFMSNLNECSIMYKFIDYAGHILKENIPISLAISIKEDRIMLRHHNKFPVFLSEDVVLFDRNIYIPSKSQLDAYKEIYNQFLKNREIKYENTIFELDKIINKIKKVTNDVFLDSNIKELNREGIKTNIIFEEDNRVKIMIDYFSNFIDIEDNKEVSFFRDKAFEEIIKITLSKYGIRKERDKFYFRGEDEVKFRLLRDGQKELNGLNIKFKDGEQIINRNKIKSSIKSNREGYKFKYTIEGLDEENIRWINREKSKGIDFLKIGNMFIDLTDEKMKEFLNLVEELQLYDGNEEGVLIEKNKLLYLEERLKNRNLDFVESEEIASKIINKIINKEFKRKLIPKEFKGELREYQKEGFRWLNEILTLGFGGILADDMGLGKTIQIIAYILSQRKKKFLIIAKTSLIYNWLEEFKKFGPSLKVGLCHGEKNKRRKTLENLKDYDVILTTYGNVKNDIEIYRNIKFFNIIIDEAQTIKNIKSQVKIALKELKSEGNIGITGTPIENNLLELWSIFDFIMPGYLLAENEFKKRYMEEDNSEELKNLINPFILRRVKGAVLKELPEKIEKNYYIELSKEEKILYKNLVKQIKEEKNLGGLIKLRQLVLSPNLVIPEYKKISSKIEALRELVIELIKEGKKVLVFSQFVSVLKEIEKELLKNQINIDYLDGSIDAKERIKLVNDFNEQKEAGVFLISLMAGGVGLNLTSASVVIHFDPWWNPKVQEQASDRAYRFGQKNIVNIIKFIAKDTIEEEIIKLQEEKEELIDNIIDDKKMDGKTLKRLSEEELKEILLN
ncbi:MAG: SNF2-related protein [Clostridium sp.]